MVDPATSAGDGSIPIEQNGHTVEPTRLQANQADTSITAPNEKDNTRKRQNARRKGPNYAQIHSSPLPLATHPLPAFHPTNPISLLRLAYVYLSQIMAPPSSHPPQPYIGFWSPETRSVHVTNPQHIRALWEMGFFGKGTLSRSEPSWLEREKARVKAKRAGGGTAEEATNARREKRRLFKLERARAEAEKIERQRLAEEGKLDPSVLETEPSGTPTEVESTSNGNAVEPQDSTTKLVTHDRITVEESDADEEDIQIENQEFLQLTMEEAFFLSYGLGVLLIQLPGTDTRSYSNNELLEQFARHSFFPPRIASQPLSPDDTFMLNYVTYHHFRSLGWVVRPGVKFSVDYLLYLRGPVFSHAEFAIIIMPSYSDPYWITTEGQSKRRIKEDEQKDWWWLHCINRVQGAVLKSLVLVYIDVPPPADMKDGNLDIGKLLKGYKVREFVVKRWLANRSRD